MFQGKCFDEISSIEDFLKDFDVTFKRGDSYYITRGDFGEDTFNEIKLRKRLVTKKNKLKSFSFTRDHYNKVKLLVQNK